MQISGTSSTFQPCIVDPYIFHRNLDDESYPLNIDRKDFYIKACIELGMTLEDATSFIDLRLKSIYTISYEKTEIFSLIEKARNASNLILIIGESTIKSIEGQKEAEFRRFLNKNMPDRKYTDVMTKEERAELERLFDIFNHFYNEN